MFIYNIGRDFYHQINMLIKIMELIGNTRKYARA